LTKRFEVGKVQDVDEVGHFTTGDLDQAERAVARKCVRLRCLRVFVDQAVEDLLTANPRGGEVDHGGWRNVGVMPAPRKYPDELRERAVRMVFEIREESGQAQGAIARVADRLGVNRETLRGWVRQAEVDGGKRPGTSTVDAQRIAELERENRN
jgi:transposase